MAADGRCSARRARRHRARVATLRRRARACDRCRGPRPLARPRQPRLLLRQRLLRWRRPLHGLAVRIRPRPRRRDGARVGVARASRRRREPRFAMAGADADRQRPGVRVLRRCRAGAHALVGGEVMTMSAGPLLFILVPLLGAIIVAATPVANARSARIWAMAAML